MTQATSKMFVGPQSTFCTLSFAWIYCHISLVPFVNEIYYQSFIQDSACSAFQWDWGKSIDFFQVSFVCCYFYFCKKEIKLLIGHTECKYFSYLTLLSFKCFVSLFHVHLIRRQCPISEFRYSQLSRELLECSMVLFNFKTHRLFFNAILNYSLLLTSQTLAICSGLFKSPGDLLRPWPYFFKVVMILVLNALGTFERKWIFSGLLNPLCFS